MKKTKNQLNKNPIIIVTLIVLALYALSIICVLGWGVLTSLKSQKDFKTMGNYIGLPSLKLSRAEALNFANFTKVFKYIGTLQFSSAYYAGSTKVAHSLGGGGKTISFFTYIIYTILYVGVGSIILAVVPAIGAYMCAKYRYKFSKIQYAVYLLFMMIPIVGAYPSELSFLRGCTTHSLETGFRNSTFPACTSLCILLFIKDCRMHTPKPPKLTELRNSACL